LRLPIELAALHPLIAQVRSLPAVFFLTSEVANALEVSPTTIRRLARTHPELAGSQVASYGRMRIPLYDDADVDRVAAHLRSHPNRRGRPRQWSDQERGERRSAHSAAGYHRRRAAVLAIRGDVDTAAFEAEIAVNVAASMKAQARTRADLSRGSRR
jgi:hypothetical protein